MPPDRSERPRVAVIGTGIAGLTCAWNLRHDAEVTLFDRERPGGHTNTVLVMEDESSFDYAESRMEVEAMEEQGMTEREKEVLSLALEGLTTREIGNKLGVSHVSVVKVRNRIKEKYGRIHERNDSRLLAHGS